MDENNQTFCLLLLLPCCIFSELPSRVDSQFEFVIILISVSSESASEMIVLKKETDASKRLTTALSLHSLKNSIISSDSAASVSLPSSLFSMPESLCRRCCSSTFCLSIEPFCSFPHESELSFQRFVFVCQLFLRFRRHDSLTPLGHSTLIAGSDTYRRVRTSRR